MAGWQGETSGLTSIGRGTGFLVIRLTGLKDGASSEVAVSVVGGDIPLEVGSLSLADSSWEPS